MKCQFIKKRMCTCHVKGLANVCHNQLEEESLVAGSVLSVGELDG